MSRSEPVHVRDVSKRHGGVTALHPTTLRAEAGETLALLGSSGSGKSTLLRLILGLLEPDAGEVFVGDRRVTTATAPALRLCMGYMPQDGGLFPHLRACDNAALVARHLRWPAPRIDARIEALSALLQLPRALLQRYPLELSGGQRQRVGLLRALMLEPAVLLLDEPLGALDPLIRAALQRELAGLFRAIDCTVLLVTHDLREARVLADRVALLHEGRLVQHGTFDDLESRPAEPFVTDFLRAF